MTRAPGPERPTRFRHPAQPRLPARTPAAEPVEDLCDEATYRGLEIGGADLAAGDATAAEFTAAALGITVEP